MLQIEDGQTLRSALLPLYSWICFPTHFLLPADVARFVGGRAGVAGGDEHLLRESDTCCSLITSCVPAGLFDYWTVGLLCVSPSGHSRAAHLFNGPVSVHRSVHGLWLLCDYYTSTGQNTGVAEARLRISVDGSFYDRT